MTSVKKNIIQYVVKPNVDDLNELTNIAKKVVNVKNYVSSRYSGICSYLIIFEPRKYTRDVWTDSVFIDSWGIPRRYIRNAIENAIA